MSQFPSFRTAVFALLAVACLAGLALILRGHDVIPAYQPLSAPKSYKLRPEALQQRGPNVIWFGHSLLQVGGGDSIDIPRTVREVHEVARRSGRTKIPHGESRTHYEGPNDLRYWFEGSGAAQKKLAEPGPSWDYVVGVGFMHLVGPGREHPSLFGLLRGLTGSDRFKTYAAYTPSKYSAMMAVREYSAAATWVNYVGPRHSDHAEEQPFVDERFECIRETADAAGARTMNVPVGRAFRAVEAARASHPDLPLALQLPDTLHLTKQGEYLAANVFYRSLYGVDPVGLALPVSMTGKLHSDPGQETKVANLLQTTARDTVDAYESGDRIQCTPAAMLAEDAEGARRLASSQ